MERAEEKIKTLKSGYVSSSRIKLNEIPVEYWSYFCQALTTLTNKTIVLINEGLAHLTEKQFELFFDSLSKLSFLTQLMIMSEEFDKFDQARLRIFCDFIANTKTLKDFSLYYTVLSEEYWQMFCDAIARNCSLEELAWIATSDTKIYDGESFKKLVIAFCNRPMKMPSYNHLDLYLDARWQFFYDTVQKTQFIYDIPLKNEYGKNRKTEIDQLIKQNRYARHLATYTLAKWLKNTRIKYNEKLKFLPLHLIKHTLTFLGPKKLVDQVMKEIDDFSEDVSFEIIPDENASVFESPLKKRKVTQTS